MSDKIVQLNWYYKRKQEMIEYLGGECSECETDINLQIHHLDPMLKEFNPSVNYSYSWETLKEELDKCILLCEHCHKSIHKPPHGTLGRYKHGPCRCKKCKKANTEYTRQYRKLRGR